MHASVVRTVSRPGRRGLALLLLLGCVADPGAPVDGVDRTCGPAAPHPTHPASQRAPDFPAYCADSTTESVPSLAFQVCDSAAADLNDDGKPELLAADHLKPAFGYFVNASSDADGVAFGSGVRVPFDQGDNSAGIVTADFNGDGRLDVANSNHPGTLTVRINGTARGASELSFPVLGETNIPLDVQYGPSFGIAGREGGLVTADFNADGRPDLATADLGQTAEPRSGRSKSCPGGDPTASRQMAAVLLNTTEVGASKATYAPTTYFPIAGPAISIASADFDGDGRPDLLTANTGDGSLSVLKNLTEPEAGVPCFGPGLRLKIPDGGLSHGAGPTNAIAIDVNVQNAYSKGAIPLSVQAVGNIKISSREGVLDNAIERFLARPTEYVQKIAKETLEANLRGVLATLTPEEVNEDRLKFAQTLIDEADDDMRTLGLDLDVLKIQNVTDEVDYLDSVGRRRTAQVIMEARVAEAERQTEAQEAEAGARRRAEIAQVNANLEIVERSNALRVREAELEALAVAKEREAEVAGEKAKAVAEQSLETERIELQKRRLEIRTTMADAGTLKPWNGPRRALQRTTPCRS